MIRESLKTEMELDLITLMNVNKYSLDDALSELDDMYCNIVDDVLTELYALYHNERGWFKWKI